MCESFNYYYSVQNNLQLVSFENMRCKRLEGVRLIQQLAIFNSESLKYLFLWDFVLQNENPLLINYSYVTGLYISYIIFISLLFPRSGHYYINRKAKLV